jgi:hypothetical protein
MIMFKAWGGRLRRLFSRHLLAYFVLAAFLFGVFFWRLASLTPGLSPAEAATRGTSLALRKIYDDPVNAPFKLIQHLFIKLDPGSILFLRLSGVILGLIFAVCFYKLAVSWFGRAIGLFGTLLFITLPLFVISARQASAEIMFFTPVILMWLYYKLMKNEDDPKPWLWSTLIIASVLSIYVPGMLLWLAGAVIICRRRLMEAISGIPAWVSGAGFTAGLVLLLPLILSAVSRPAIIKKLILLPDHWSPVLRTIENIGWMASSLFIGTPAANPLIIGRLPLINILLLALLIFGAYALYTAARPKAYVLGLAVLYAVLAAGLSNNVVVLALGLPAIALFISAGLRYLYIEWRSIFPRNPVPKTFALILIAAVVASQVFFGLRYSLVAWPHSAATRAHYVLK